MKNQPGKRKIFVLCPSFWDLCQLNAPTMREKYEFHFFGENIIRLPMNLSNIWFDLDRFMSKAEKEFRRLDCEAVIGPHDFVACLFAAILSERLGLPGPPVHKMILSQHKYHSRIEQKKVAPEVVPEFQLASPWDRNLDLTKFDLPLFIKPIKATFSILAKQIHTIDEFEDFMAIGVIKELVFKKLLRPFNSMIRRYTDYRQDSNCFIVEELLKGEQFTVEGFVEDGEVQILSAIDSILYPDSVHFIGFVMPSRLNEQVLQRAHQASRKIIKQLELERTFFNIEFFYDADTDRLTVIEVNSRMCYQFADLYEKVYGFNTYDLQISLSLGDKINLSKQPAPFKTAGAFALRTFVDKKVKQVPDRELIERLEKEFPSSQIIPFGIKGRRLSKEPQDIGSYLYALINLGGHTEKELFQGFNSIRKILDREFELENEEKLDHFFQAVLNGRSDDENRGTTVYSHAI